MWGENILDIYFNKKLNPDCQLMRCEKKLDDMLTTTKTGGNIKLHINSYF